MAYVFDAKISCGSYTGDGGTNRHIYTGFRCKLVILQANVDDDAETDILLNTSRGIQIWHGGNAQESTDIKLDSSNGFWVSGSVGNDNGQTFDWVAFGY